MDARARKARTKPKPGTPRIVRRRSIHTGKKFRFEMLTVRYPSGKEKSREVVRHPGAVVIVALTDDRRLVLIRVFRISVGKWLSECCAGTLEKGEAPKACAKRELTEETGFKAATLTSLGWFYTTPGLTDEKMHAFVATGLTHVGQDLEEDEAIKVEIVTMSNALDMIRRGRMRDAKSMTAILLAQRAGLLGDDKKGGADMGFQDRRYDERGGGDFGEGGGFKRAWRRMFVEGDDFFSWSVPLFNVPRGVPAIGGIRVRMHLLFIVFIAIELISAARHDTMGFAFKAFLMGTLWALVLLHEFGHCVACRYVGGEADRVLLWPLGGLASCRPPHNWKASLITTIGGPGVNFVLIPIMGGALLALGAGWETVVFNPFNPDSVLRNAAWLTHDTAYWRYLVWTAYYANFILFAFNMCLVMYPMDAGRIVQELLWSRLGYKRSMVIATNLGLLIAIILGVYALTVPQGILLGIAVFGGITCFQQRRALEFIEDTPAWAYDTDRGSKGFGTSGVGKKTKSPAEQDKAYNAALKRQEKERLTQVEVDRILDKIRDQGMGSLTRKERAVLKDATERQRGGG